jgi:hypothetical protein
MGHTTVWKYTYRDFDGQSKSTTCKVTEKSEGVFYAFNEFGCGKDADSSIYWKPIPQAIKFLMGGDRDIVAYEEVK